MFFSHTILLVVNRKRRTVNKKRTDMSKLEQFIRDNRNEFDNFEPRADLWQEIDQQLKKEDTKVRPLWFRTPVMRYAAAAVILLLAGYGVFQLGRTSVKTETSVNIAQINPELAQAEAYYTSLINEEKSLLDPKEIEALGLKDEFNEDLVTLDSAYRNLKKQLVSEANKEPIVAAMIKNLQLRVEIIRQQIETLQRVNQYKRKENPSANI